MCANLISICFSAVAALVSLATLWFSLHKYRKLDKVIGEQQRLINDYTIAKLQKDKEEAQRANFDMRYYSIGGGKACFQVRNDGAATANNIRIHFKTSRDGLFHLKEFYEYDSFSSGDTMEITTTLGKDMPNSIDVSINWEDPSSIDNIVEKTIQLR